MPDETRTPDALRPPTSRRMLLVGDLALLDALEGSIRTEHRTARVPSDELDARFRAAVDDFDGADVVVCGHFEPELLVSRPLVDTPLESWQSAVGRTLGVVRKTTVLASAPLHASTGQLVFVIPTIAMTGAAGWVPLATAAEGTRSWAKSVARQWAGARVGVNCVATSLPLILGDGSPDPVPAYIGVGFTAGNEPAVADVRAALEALTGPLASHSAGATITVDGGVHMEP